MRWKKLVIYIEKQKMKKLWLLILWLCCLFFVWNFTQAKDYEYTNLDITADVLIDWTINVKEDFMANFFVNKHWIIRDIPLNYSVEWNDFHIKVSNIYVQWKNFKTSKNNWNIEIKIWDANRTIIWEQSYPISYTTYGLIRNFSGMWYAELYWNLVGYDFDTNINKVHAVINLPKSYTWFTKDDFLITTDWQSKTIDGFEWTIDWSQWDKIIISYDKWLPAFQWITLAIKFPNNYFEFDHKAQKKLIWKYNEFFLTRYIRYILGHTWIFEIIFVCIFLFWFIVNIPTKIRERLNIKKYPVIVQYSAPEGMTPSEVWLLYYRKPKTSQIISLIYQRASQWYISFKTWDETWIIKNSDLYNLDEKKAIEKEDYMQSTRKAMFNKKNKMSVPNTYFNQRLKSLEDKVYRYGLKQSWFKYKVENKNNIEKWVRLKFVIWFFLAVFFSLAIEYLHLLLLSLIWLLLSFLLAAFDGKNALSDKWYKLLAEIKWYRNFIKACDENKFKELLKEDPMFFDKTLPYAIALWLETSFMKKFEPILKESWVSSYLTNSDSEISPRKTMREINSGIHNQSYSYKWWKYSSYSSSSWWSSWSSFGWGGWWGWFSSGWWGGWWGWRSW